MPATAADAAPGAAPAAAGDATFRLLATAVALEAVGIGMIFPLLAHLQAARHLPTSGLGLMSGASFFAALAAQVGLVGHLDGRRARPLLLGGLGLGAAALVWFALAPDLWQLAAARAAGGVSYGLVMPAALRAGSVGLAPEQAGARLGRLSSAQMAGIVLGPLAGVALYSVGDLRTPFLVLAVATTAVLVALAAARRGRPAPAGGAPGSEGGAPGAGAAVGRPSPRSRPVVALLLLAAASQLPNGLYDALWSRLLTDRGAATLLIGLSLTFFGLPFIVLAPLGGRLAARGWPLGWAGAGLVVAAGFMASYGLVRSAVVICGLGVLEACAQAVAVPGGYAATAATFPERWAATGQGWFQAAGTAAAGAAALVAAPAYAALGPGPVFAGGAACSVLAVLAAVALDRPGALRRRRPARR